MFTTAIRSTVGTAIALLLGVLLCGPATAQEGNSTWGLSPAGAEGPDGRPAIERVVDPGEVVLENVLVSNLGAQELALRVYAADGLTTASGGFDLLGSDEPSEGVGSWSTPAAGELLLAAGERRVVPVRIEVPEDAEPGDHAGGVVAAVTSGVDAGGVVIERRVGTRVYLRVSGPVVVDLTVDQLDGDYSARLIPGAAGGLQLTWTV